MNQYGESLQFYLVDVKEIESEVARSTFDGKALEELADLIVATGCLLKPLVLKQINPMKYKVLEGHFEYYAAVSAHQKDVQRVLSGMVSAFVVKPEVENIAIEQAKILNKTTPKIEAEVSTDSSFLMNRMSHLETKLERELQAIKTIQLQNMQRLEEAIKQSSLQVLEMLKDTLKSENIVKLTTSTDSQPIGTEVESEILNALNTWSAIELVQRLKAVITPKIIENVIQEREKAPFSNLKDVTQRKVSIGEARMKKIITTWKK